MHIFNIILWYYIWHTVFHWKYCTSRRFFSSFSSSSSSLYDSFCTYKTIQLALINKTVCFVLWHCFTGVYKSKLQAYIRGAWKFLLEGQLGPNKQKKIKVYSKIPKTHKNFRTWPILPLDKSWVQSLFYTINNSKALQLFIVTDQIIR